ncbi:hypothetical protein ENUP19_0341G0065 [Entamoeba nuttalli]|uniref:Transmembrane protein tmp21, putative n=2 Tax=Entamoeba nuttalli TaxID=412467 RepID=K2HP91_ENTNP|nr:transmembrane protein tmp21, putative [Entamoeba nuttalli P19]EKE37650.1 transmembrane protein tmp21, putative [Entamoeba nuttalli P19]|eukprot:XP_008860019.1 transmembrane protein tmp21, putative [Entamoeba nuttalli P19]
MFALIFFIQLSIGFIMEVPTNGFRCISDEGFDKERAAGTYRLAEGQSLDKRQVVFKIFRGEKDRTEIFSADFDDTKKPREFGALYNEDLDKLYFCVIDSANSRGIDPVRVEINFETGKVENNFVGKDKIDTVSDKVDDALKNSEAIKEYVDKCKKLYDTRRGLNEATNSMTLWMMILVICAVIGSTLYQLRSMKQFFLRRKLV